LLETPYLYCTSKDKVLQKALELTEENFCVFFCSGKKALEKYSKFNPNKPRAKEEVIKVFSNLKSIDGVAILIPENFLILDIDTKEEKTFWKFFQDFSFQETQRGYHIPVFFSEEFLEEYKKLPDKLGSIEILKEKNTCLVFSFLDNRDWNFKKEKILKIEKVEDLAKFKFFVCSFNSLEIDEIKVIENQEQKVIVSKKSRKESRLLEFTKKREFVDFIMQKAGRKPVEIGKSFKCIIHKEKNESASWFRTYGGEIVYRDWHKKSGEEFFTLGEIYHALKTGNLKKLSPFLKAKWLEYLIVDYLISENNLEETKNEAIRRVETDFLFFHFLYLAGYDEGEEIKNVFDFIMREFYSANLIGVNEINLSTRFLSSNLDLKIWKANRILNLLCILGFFEKRNSIKGSRIVISEIPDEERERRFKLLFEDLEIDLRKMNQKYVMEKLGENIIKNVYKSIPESVILVL